MARPPAWTCPRCNQRADPRFHECEDIALDTEVPPPMAALGPDDPYGGATALEDAADVSPEQ